MLWCWIKREIRAACSSVRQPLSGVAPPAWQPTAYAAGRRLALLGSCAVSLLCALCIRRDAKVSGSALWGTRLHARWRSRISIACSLSFASSTASSTNDFCSRISLWAWRFGRLQRTRYKRTANRGQKEAGGVRIASDSRGGAGEGQEPPPAASGAQEGVQRLGYELPRISIPRTPVNKGRSDIVLCGGLP